MGTVYEQVIVLIIVFTASFLTWKMVKDFYKDKFHMIFTHLIAIITASFMLLSTMFLFAPKNYQRGSGQSEVELTFSSVGIVIIMLAVLYLLFVYLPKKKSK
jgi:Na+-driven multidrug efflux pump